MDKPIEVSPQLKIYRITCRMESFVKANNENEAKCIFEGQSPDKNQYVEMLSLQEYKEDSAQTNKQIL
jgi:hypothetical protein